MTEPSSDAAVRVERVLPASPEEVYDAWTDPQTLRRFMCPHNVLFARVEADVRVGGKFRLDMVHADHTTEHYGEYRELDRPRKLVFTWRSKYTAERDTLVTILLSPEGENTRLVLIHEQLPSDKARQQHTGGWTSCLEKLSEYLATTKAADDFRTTVRLAAPLHSVYQALTTQAGLAGWWTDDCTIGTREGDENEFRFPRSSFFARFKIRRLVPDSLVEWECLDSLHPAESGFKNRRDWVGTKVKFELRAADSAATELRFTHVGLLPRLECNGTCRNVWWHFLHQSLRTYMETGTGLPYTDKKSQTIPPWSGNG
jgi:uncharacterized protein YndB with AHSA1/START domain